MRHEWTQVTVDGFGAEETDFLPRLAASPQSVRDDFENLIMSPLVNSPDGAVLLIEAHSDRVDTGDHHANLNLERKVSTARRISAENAVLAKFGEWLMPGPTAWSQLTTLGVFATGVGANVPVDDADSEVAALRNRRVIFRVCRFFADE